MAIISNLLYRLYLLFTDKPKKTALHPDYKKLIDYAFSIPDESGKAVDYYSFRSAADMPTARYGKWNEFLEDYNRRFDNQELKIVLTEIQSCLEENSVKGVTNALSITTYALERTQIAMDTDLFMRFCSVSYFTLDEDLLSYDWDLGTEKIEKWTNYGMHAFFLKEPVKRWLPQTTLSKEDLATLQYQKRELKRIFRKQKSGKST